MPHSSALVLCLSLLVTPNSAKSPQPHSYEHYVRPTTNRAGNRALIDEAHAWAQRRHRALAYDERLAKAARSQAEALSHSPQQAIDMEALVRAGWMAGWTDGQVMAIALRGRPEHLKSLLTHELDSQPSVAGWTHFGVASQMLGRQGDLVAVVALSERPLRLAPLPAHRRTRQPIRVHGLIRDPSIQAIHLTYATTTSRIFSRSVSLSRWPAFDCRILTPTEPGVMMLEMMIERGHGPELAAQLPITIGHAHHSSLLRSRTAATTVDTMDPASSLQHLILGLRQAHGLPIPKNHVGLGTVAERRLATIEHSGALVHVAADGSSVLDQLHDAHLAYHHVVENLGEAGSPFEIFEAWRESPSHLENLLDDRVEQMGLAVAQSKAGGPYTAALVMATLREPS